MPAVDLSIIFPVRNIELELPGILRTVLRQSEGLHVELIVVDMGSSDHTVLEAVQFLKEGKGLGFVLQNGGGSVSSALNSGLQKACGNYITFVFARRLYHDFIHGYYETANRFDADFIYGRAGKAGRLTGKTDQTKSGEELMLACLKGEAPLDISALMLRREFLQTEHLLFSEECKHGYAEEFVYKCLLCAHSVVQSPTLLQRDRVYELKRGKQENIGGKIFQHTEAIVRVKNLAASQKAGKELLQLLDQQKLPQTVMHGVDVMLREGNGYNAVRGYLHVSGYDKFLHIGRGTSPALRRRILLWRAFPWMYRPEPI